MGQAKIRKQLLGTEYGKQSDTAREHFTPWAQVNAPILRRFKGGTCRIIPAKVSVAQQHGIAGITLDEPDRYWVEVRFDEIGGAGFQFESWQDEWPMLDRDIRTNFQHSSVAALPLVSPTKLALVNLTTGALRGPYGDVDSMGDEPFYVFDTDGEAQAARLRLGLLRSHITIEVIDQSGLLAMGVDPRSDLMRELRQHNGR